MQSEGSVTHWIRDVKAGDEAAAERLWERYWGQLLGLVRKRVGGFALGGTDEEDIALSAFNTFLDGAKRGRFPRLRDRDNLWRLLVVITARKASAHVKRGRTVPAEEARTTSKSSRK